MKGPSSQKRHKHATQHLSPECRPPQLLRRCPTVRERTPKVPQGTLDVARLRMSARQPQRRLALMACLCPHGRE